MEQIGPLYILIIDDEPETSAILSELLKRRFTAQMQTASDCASARKLLQESHFDLITLDYQLPDGNGLELLEEIKAVDASPRVIMVTGHGDETVAGNCFKLGASGYVVKDNRISVMLPEAVEHVLAEIALERAEKEARREREKAREYLDVAAVIILAVSNTGDITLINRIGSEVLGYPENEIIGKNFFEAFVPEDAREKVRKSFERVIAEEEETSDRYEIPLIARDGSTKIASWRNALLRDEKGGITGLIASGEDITELKRAEKINRTQHEISTRLSGTDDFNESLRIAVGAILEATGLDSGGVYIKDMKTGALDLVYHQGHTEAFIEEVSRFEPDSVNAILVQQGKSLYANYSKITTEKSPAKVQEGLKALAVIPITFKGEVVGCINLASHKFEEISEESQEVIETLTDLIGQAITRAGLSTALRESEATYRAIFDHAPEAIGLFDTKGRLKDANDATTRWLGYSKVELLGKMIYELPFLPKDKLDESLEMFTRAMSGESLASFVLEHIAKNGEKFYGHVSPTFIKDENGQVVGAMVITADITNRVKKEEELEEYERQYKSVFQNTSELILIYDSEGRIAAANPAALMKLGYEDEAELVGTLYIDLIPSEDVELLVKNGIENGALRDREVRYKRKDGSILHGIGSGELFFDESGKAVGGETVFSDITKLKEAEKALMESEELFRTVFEQVEIGMALIDVNEGRILRTNEALCRITGFSEEDLLTFQFPDMIHPDDIEIVKDTTGGFFGGEEPTLRFRARIQKKDGSVAWVDISTAVVKNESGVIYAIGSASDITDQKLVEDELRFAKERWERSFEEMADGIIQLSPDLDILECNKAFCDIARKNREDIIGMKCHSLIHGTDMPPAYCVCRKVKKNKKIEKTELYEPHLKRSLEISANPILNSGGDIEQVIHVIHDTTRRRKAEKELVKHREHLEDLVGDRTSELKSVNKRLTEEIIWRTKIELDLKRANTELEDYAHTVSHDLKGPLSSISLSADMLLDEASGIESEETRREVQELVGSIKRHAGKSFKLADDLLALSRAGNIPEEVEEVDIGDVITEILEERKGTIDEKGIIFNIGDDMGKVRADSTQIYVLFSNIIGNAIIHNDSKSPEITVSYLGTSGGDHGYLVKDNGSGVLAGEEENIFRAFRKSPVSEGTGVGLATALKIVDVYSGVIKAYNDNGACFEFTLKDFNP